MRGLARTVFGSRKKKVVSALITGVVMVAAAGTAAWLVTTTTGSGSGKTGSLVAPTITNASAPAGNMFPTGAFDSPIQMTVNNPNSGALILTGLGPIDKSAIVGGDAACDFSTVARKADVLVKPTATAGLSIAIPVGSSQVSVPNLIGLGSATPSNCQNMTIDGFGLSNVTFSTP